MVVTPAQILAAAFHNDAMFVFIEPDGERRRALADLIQIFTHLEE